MKLINHRVTWTKHEYKYEYSMNELIFWSSYNNYVRIEHSGWRGTACGRECLDQFSNEGYSWLSLRGEVRRCLQSEISTVIAMRYQRNHETAAGNTEEKSQCVIAECSTFSAVTGDVIFPFERAQDQATSKNLNWDLFRTKLSLGNIKLNIIYEHLFDSSWRYIYIHFRKHHSGKS